VCSKDLLLGLLPALVSCNRIDAHEPKQLGTRHKVAHLTSPYCGH
jgi:hypothetical protein